MKEIEKADPGLSGTKLPKVLGTHGKLQRCGLDHAEKVFCCLSALEQPIKDAASVLFPSLGTMCLWTQVLRQSHTETMHDLISFQAGTQRSSSSTASLALGQCRSMSG